MVVNQCCVGGVPLSLKGKSHNDTEKHTNKKRHITTRNNKQKVFIHTHMHHAYAYEHKHICISYEFPSDYDSREAHPASEDADDRSQEIDLLER